MFFNTITLLPQLFETGQSIIRCINGGATQEEIEEAITEVRELLEQIPPLRGFMAIFDIVVKVARAVLPIILDNKVKIVDDEGNTVNLGLTAQELDQAANVVTLYSGVMKEAAKSEDLAPDMIIMPGDVEGMV